MKKNKLYQNSELNIDYIVRELQGKHLSTMVNVSSNDNDRLFNILFLRIKNISKDIKIGLTKNNFETKIINAKADDIIEIFSENSKYVISEIKKYRYQKNINDFLNKNGNTR